jgi:hypothetical protein
MLLGDAATRLIETELRNACALATDTAFLTVLDAVDTVVASNGGGTAEAVLADLAGAVAVLDTRVGSNVWAIMSPTLAKRVALLGDQSGPAFPDMTLAGGRIGPVNVAVSAAAADDAVLVVDASGLGVNVGAIGLSASGEASLQLDTAPTQASSDGSSPPGSTASTAVSLFQVNATAIRATRWWGASAARAGVVAKLTSVAWGMIGSPA